MQFFINEIIAYNQYTNIWGLHISCDCLGDNVVIKLHSYLNAIMSTVEGRGQTRCQSVVVRVCQFTFYEFRETSLQCSYTKW